MHDLLGIDLRVARLRRRCGEAAAWVPRHVLPVGPWTFDGAPIEIGHRWPDVKGVKRFESGPFEVPADWPLEAARLALDVGGESLLTIRYDDGREVRLGHDPYHRSFPLDGRAGRLVVEGVARDLFGAPSRDPRLIRAELVWTETALEDLLRALELVAEAAVELRDHEVAPMLLSLAEETVGRLRWPTATADVLGRESPFAHRYGGRDQVIEPYPATPLPDDALASVAEGDTHLRHGLRALRDRYPPIGAIALVGHAHIDAAWLWPLDETRRKVVRTFSTQVELLDRHPDFRFAQSFAEYYRDLEDRDPALLERIQAHAAAGRWEPVGGFWVEPDINMLSGESLARQALYGQRLFERLFGRRHTVGWLPDTFGFSAGLPQVLKAAGLEGMYTVKIGWSETNVFPHTRFWWEGIDGSRVLVQQMNRPEDNYNGRVGPRDSLRLWRNHAEKAIAPETFQPIGWGDGGGGPTEEMIRLARRLADFPVLPRLRFTSVADYYATAAEQAAEAPLPVWRGELSLEYHRGVLTSQGRMKRLHRRAEHALRTGEIAGALAEMAGGPRAASLEPSWRTLMVNQFHDILPGSSIGDVYRRTEPELAEVAAAGEAATATALEALGPGGGGEGLVVLNPSLSERPIRLQSPDPLPAGQAAEDGWVLASEEIAPPLSTVSGRPAASLGVTVEPGVLENRFLRVEIAADGTLSRVFDKRAGREVLDGRGAQIWAYHDQPRDYDAWDIEEDYRRQGCEVVAAEPPQVVEAGGQRGAIRIVRRIGASTIVQSVRLWANSPRIDFATRFDWHDRRILLKALFPLAVRSDFATFECAFGVVRRPTHRNTSWDAAKFEVPVHRFVDLSETGYGAAVLNDGRYGCHVEGGEIGLSLLKSPVLPDRLADEGQSGLVYALLPHAGDWVAGGVLAEAEDLNQPLPFRPAPAGPRRVFAPATVSGTPVALSALKPAEDGDGLILRVYEPFGARGPVEVSAAEGWSVAGEVSLLEDRIADGGPITPFQVRSWRLRKTG